MRHWQSVSAATLRRLVFCLWQTRAPAVRPVWNARRTSLMRQSFSSMSAALILSFCSSLPLTSSHGQCIFVHIPALPHWHSVFCPRPLPAFCPAFCFWQTRAPGAESEPAGCVIGSLLSSMSAIPSFCRFNISFFRFFAVDQQPLAVHFPPHPCAASLAVCILHVLLLSILAFGKPICPLWYARGAPLALCILSTSTSSTFVFVFFSFALSIVRCQLNSGRSCVPDAEKIFCALDAAGRNDKVLDKQERKGLRPQRGLNGNRRDWFPLAVSLQHIIVPCSCIVLRSTLYIVFMSTGA